MIHSQRKESTVKKRRVSLYQAYAAHVGQKAGDNLDMPAEKFTFGDSLSQLSELESDGASVGSRMGHAC